MATQQTFEFLEARPAKAVAETSWQRSRLPAAPTSPEHAPIEPVSVEPVPEHPPKADPAVEADAGTVAPEDNRADVIRRLQHQVGSLSVAGTHETFSTGSDAVDRLLPRPGLRIDAVTEWVADADGCGAASLAIIAARVQLQRSPGPLVVVGGAGTFYPPAAVSLGIEAERIIWVRPARHADVVWSIDQALRCETIAAVWAHVGPNLDDRDARRFQLAAEEGRTPGLLVRPCSVRGRPSFAEVRFHVSGHTRSTVQSGSMVRSGSMGSRSAAEDLPGAAREVTVTLDRCRGGVVGRQASLKIDAQGRIHETDLHPHSRESDHHETATVRLARELAHPTSAKSIPRRRLA